MHGQLSRDRTLDHDPAPKQAGKGWIVALLAVGGVLTLAWVAFLLWAAVELVI